MSLLCFLWFAVLSGMKLEGGQGQFLSLNRSVERELQAAIEVETFPDEIEAIAKKEKRGGRNEYKKDALMMNLGSDENIFYFAYTHTPWIRLIPPGMEDAENVEPGSRRRRLGQNGGYHSYEYEYEYEYEYIVSFAEGKLEGIRPVPIQFIIETQGHYLKAGNHEGEIIFEFYRTKTSYDVKQVVFLPISLELQVDPDPFESTVDFRDCQSVEWGGSCAGTIQLRDIDGMALQLGGFANQIMVKVDNLDTPNPAARGIYVSDLDNGTYFVEVQIVSIGRLQISAFLGADEIGDRTQFQVECPASMDLFLQKGGAECACQRGYEVNRETYDCVPCAACDSGQIYSDQDKDGCRCINCAQGFFCPNASAIFECPKGHQCPFKTMEPILCPQDRFQPRPGQPDCIPCPLGTSTNGLEGATSIKQCFVCPEGADCWINSTVDETDARAFFMYGPEETGIKACSNHSVPYRMTPKPGYFRFPTLQEYGVDDLSSCAPDTFFKCPNQESCPGVANLSSQVSSSECAMGYSGFLCSSCSEGFAKNNDGKCIECSTSNSVVVAIFAIFVLILMVFFMTLRTMRRTKFRGKDVQAIAVLKIVFSHLQVIAMMTNIQLQWSDKVTKMFSSANVLSAGSTEMVSIDCIFSNVTRYSTWYYAKVLVTAMLPVIFALFCGFIWLSLKQIDYCVNYRTNVLGRINVFGDETEDAADHDRKRRKTQARFYKYGFQLSMIVSLFVMHILLVRTALGLFVCTDAYFNRRFLERDPSVECGTSSHIAWSLCLGLLMIIVYGIGIPVYSAVLVKKSENPWIRIFLCSSFRRDYEYWESVISTRKCLFAIATIFLERYGFIVQSGTCLLILFLAYSLQLSICPFRGEWLNRIEFWGLVTSFVTLVTGLFLATVEDGSISHTVFTVFIFLYNVVFLIFAFGFFTRDVSANYGDITTMIKRMSTRPSRGGEVVQDTVNVEVPSSEIPKPLESQVLENEFSIDPSSSKNAVELT